MGWLLAQALALTSPVERREQGRLVFALKNLAQSKGELETVQKRRRETGILQGWSVQPPQAGWGLRPGDTPLELPQDSPGYYLMMAITTQLGWEQRSPQTVLPLFFCGVGIQPRALDMLHPSHGLPHSTPFNLYNLWGKQGDTKIHTAQPGGSSSER